MNKRGQGLSINAVVIIVLAIIVLVVLVLAFSGGFNRFREILGGGNNADVIVAACQQSCATNNKAGFCTQTRILKDDSGIQGAASDNANEYSGTCDLFVKDGAIREKYGFSSCSTIICESSA